MAELLSPKDQIIRLIISVWQSPFLTEEARRKREKLKKIFENHRKVVAVPYGSLIAAANNASDYDLQVYYEQNTFLDALKTEVAALGDVSFTQVKIDRFDNPGKIFNPHILLPQKQFNIPHYPNILLTPDIYLGGDLEFAAKIRLALIENLLEFRDYDERWHIMLEGFFAYFSSNKFLKRSNEPQPQVKILVKSWQAQLSSFQKLSSLISESKGKITI